MPLVGPITVAVSDWARPRAGESTMFDHALIERLTMAHPGPLLAIYGTAGLASVAIGLRAGISWTATGLTYLAGLLAWTFVEYAMHRFSFHHPPASERQVAFGYLVHGVHHAYPDDARRWVMPLVVTVPIGMVLLATSWRAFGAAGLPPFAGFAHGYLAYDTFHWAIHRNALGGAIGRFLRKHHLQHHYATPERRFGVSSPLWDVVFGTLR